MLAERERDLELLRKMRLNSGGPSPRTVTLYPTVQLSVWLLVAARSAESRWCAAARSAVVPERTFVRRVAWTHKGLKLLHSQSCEQSLVVGGENKTNHSVSRGRTRNYPG